MNKGLYIRLAKQNIRKNKSTFLPFLLSGIVMAAMFYMLDSIRQQCDDTLFFGASTMEKVLIVGVIVAGLFSVCVLFYTDGFLMKQRSKEFGLYSLLGMEKKHISKVVFWELAIIGSGSIVIGLLAGILFSRLMFMVLLKIIRINTDFQFRIMPSSILATIVLFAGVFVAIMLANMVRVFSLKPIELMRSTRQGEKEPKAKWLLAIIGVVSLGYGYYLAQTAENPLKAIKTFLTAVLCVIVGTYLLFLSGSIAVLKLLKKNRRFYYHKKHFITVSGMMYRMKQNAVGLANICILCTGVLVVLSSTVSLYVGIEDIMRTRYPMDVMTEFLYEEGNEDVPDSMLDEWKASYHYDYDKVIDMLYKRADSYNVSIEDMQSYYIYSMPGSFLGTNFKLMDGMTFSDYASATELSVIDIDDYNTLTGENESLSSGEVLIYSTIDDLNDAENITINDRAYKVAGRFSNMPIKEAFSSVFENVMVVVDSLDEIKAINNYVNENSTDGGISNIIHQINYNLTGKLSDKNAFCTRIRDNINDTGIAHLASVDDIYTTRPEMLGIYGGLFFVGIFIGTLFLVTTVMIIYYKQLSEGYDDRERFSIMQKVGMSKSEVKSVIRSQILQVFFLPIALAILHICFAFKIIKDMLVTMNFTNVALFVKCTVVTALVFTVVYFIVYCLTAKTYYKITSDNI